MKQISHPVKHVKRPQVIKIVFTVICIALVVLLAFACKKIYHYKLQQKDDMSKMLQDSIRIEPEQTIYFEDLGTDNFTSTGLAFDSCDNSFWVADHGSSSSDPLKLYEFDAEFKRVINEVLVDELTVTSANLQGICYDEKNDSLWIAVGNAIHEVSKDGNIIQSITIDEFEYRTNGICFDKDKETIWVLCYSRYLLKLRTPKSFHQPLSRPQNPANQQYPLAGWP